MTAIHVKSEVKIDFDQLLDGVTQLDTPALEHLLSQLSVVLARRKAPSLSRQESLLLQKINRGLPTTTQQRYAELRAKLHSETIAADEYQELLGLIDEVELADANRLQALIELAHLRNISLAEIMDQLSIHPPQPIYG
jgi:hypothetical protein